MNNILEYMVSNSSSLKTLLRRALARTRLGKAFYIVVAFILIEPAWFNEFPVIDAGFILTKIGLMCVALAVLVDSKDRALVFLVAIYGVYLVGDTATHGGDIVSALKNAVNCMCFISIPLAMADLYQDRAFDAFRMTFEILVVCNFMSVIAAPEGLYQVVRSTGWTSNACWFLGLRNGMPPIYVTAACLEYAAVVRGGFPKKEVIRCAVFLAVATLTIALISSSTSRLYDTGSAGGFLVVWAVVLLVPMLWRVALFRRTIQYAVAVALNYLLAFLLVVVRIQNVFSFLIVDLLGKDLTLSNRTLIWDAAMREIDGNFLFGFGVEPEITMASKLGRAAAVSTTHNGWLDMFYLGGLVLFIIIIILFVYCGHEIAKQKCSRDGRYLIGCFTGIYLFTGQTEALVGPRFFLFIAMLMLLSRVLKSGTELGASEGKDASIVAAFCSNSRESSQMNTRANEVKP